MGLPVAPGTAFASGLKATGLKAKLPSFLRPELAAWHLPFFIFVLQMVTLACIAYCKEKLIVDRVGAPFAWAARDTCC